MSQSESTETRGAVAGEIGLLTSIAWIVAASAIGFAIPFFFSNWLQLERAVYIVPYVIIIGAFVVILRRASGTHWSVFTHRWGLGIAGAAVFGYYVVLNVLGQPESASPSGLELVWALIWFGLIYGLVDALSLNVFPVLCVRAVHHSEASWTELVLRGAAAIAASAVIAGAYHLGYAEFRGIGLLAPIVGNTLLTLSFVLTRSPLAPIGAHIAMHGAGVLHGMESVVQLPPHY
ncbi:hypothetical protein [Hoeflea sp.]|uniref:hypothetical protein n=1 Tax=Hoeflea sp. TaxID=1940281 RepID=UPI0019AB2A67|nr:hypothetical protein [Hoeflea sp.]MBC7280941.1 hypothetical protein [Hoeflea sp.]